MEQVSEQLHVNLVAQAQLLSPSFKQEMKDEETSGCVRDAQTQLQLQQQQLIQQLHVIQRHLLLCQSLSSTGELCDTCCVTSTIELKFKVDSSIS